MVTLQILVLPFLVRVQVGQQREIRRALDVELGAFFMLLYVKGVEEKRKEGSVGKICDDARKREKRRNRGA